MTEKHAQTPWKRSDDNGIVDKENYELATCYSGSVEEDIANARHIVHCVNMHTELVEALKGLSDMYGAAFDMVGGDLIMTGSHVDLFEERHAKAQEVLNKATKEG